MKILALLRPENASLVRTMTERGWEVYAPEGICLTFRQRGLPVQPFERMLPEPTSFDWKPLSGRILVSDADHWDRLKDTLLPQWEETARLCACIVDGVLWMKEHVGLDALIVWTDAIPETRAAIFACRSLGVPSFEVRHGCWNTYKQGHFECESLVDTVLSHGQEDVDFLRFYGNTNDIVVTGKPSLDWLEDGRINRAGLKEQFRIPPNRPVVVYGGTWRHRFSYWEMQESEVVGLKAMLRAHAALQPTCNPYLVIKLHPQVGHLVHGVRDFCQAFGATEFSVVDADPHLVLPFADCLVSHKSSLVPEAMIHDVPCVVFEYREFNDFGFHPSYGFIPVTHPQRLAHAIALALLDKPTKERLAVERESAKHYFLGPLDGKAAERCCDTIHARVTARAALPVAV